MTLDSVRKGPPEKKGMHTHTTKGTSPHPPSWKVGGGMFLFGFWIFVVSSLAATVLGSRVPGHRSAPPTPPAKSKKKLTQNVSFTNRCTAAPEKFEDPCLSAWAGGARERIRRTSRKHKILRKTFFNFAPALGPGHSKRIIEKVEWRFPKKWEIGGRPFQIPIVQKHRT